MPAERGSEAKEDPKDLDAIVSSFLQELDLLSTQIHPPPGKPLTPAGGKPVGKARRQIRSAAGRARAFFQHRHGRFVLVFSAAAAIMLGCWLYFRPTQAGTPRQAPPAASKQLRTPVPVPPPGRLNDTALLLAGLPVGSESPFYELSAKPAFRRHRKEMEVFWKRVRTGNLAAIRRWRDENIPAGLERNPVLYPLSGADYLNACAFYPHAPEYLLLALESPGAIPRMHLLSDREIEKSLSAVRSTVQSAASVNYLQSRALREDLANSSFDGIAPLLLLFAAGLGHSIRDVHPVIINPDGLLVRDTEENAPKKFRRVAGNDVPESAIRGVRIQYVDGVEKISKSITYLQIELRNQTFSEGRPEGRFLSGLKNRNTILKSAVYLLHGNSYGTVREFILGSSDLIIQDDSGIPYRYFPGSTWKEYLFGSYTRAQPLGTLRNPPQQPLLAQQYALGSRPLAFPYGYGVLWGKGRSNLMMFVRR